MEKTLHPSRFRFGIDLPAAGDGERIVMPLRRSPVAILIVAVMAVVMTVPAISVFGQAAADWGRLDSLFDLVGALFSTGWLMGWGTGLLFLYGILALLVTGRETLILDDGRVDIRLGLPLLFFGVTLDPGRIQNLHHSIPEPKSSKAWRGPHLAFEYDGAPLEVGSGLNEVEALQLAARLRALPPAKTGFEDTPVEPHAAPADRTETAIEAGDRSPLTRLSALALVAANLLPIAGVLLMGWDLGAIMVLFWAESGIIGFYHVLKLAVTRRWLAMVFGPAFVGHFGAFMAVHFLFIYGIFIEGFTGNGPGDSLAEVAQVFVQLWPALLALTLSHGVSFFGNFLGRGEYRDMTLRDEMSGPYRRIVIMHVTIIIGGGLSLALGTPVIALMLLILLKTAIDLRAHIRQRSQARPA